MQQEIKRQDAATSPDAGITNGIGRTHGSTHIKCPLITQGSEYLEKALEVRFM